MTLIRDIHLFVIVFTKDTKTSATHIGMATTTTTTTTDSISPNEIKSNTSNTNNTNSTNKHYSEIDRTEHSERMTPPRKKKWKRAKAPRQAVQEGEKEPLILDNKEENNFLTSAFFTTSKPHPQQSDTSPLIAQPLVGVHRQERKHHIPLHSSQHFKRFVDVETHLRNWFSLCMDRDFQFLF
jgi:hypothetical protein